ncbi:class I SAM-dependent methyltransferase [Enhygromyxa salina]|uniref:Cypemycin methyltransferase n=1 Tax=Enhygromyxa salina TaxID=215803 RepID=A0A2S9YXR6_9BACT|nr:class I SAM-dependent methyltransferase [Enhygromyxa salina]PRQ09862.1 Cypemycin methyltransferase [Enhygromyxa salina]
MGRRDEQRAKGKHARAEQLAQELARGTTEHYVDPLLYDLEYADQHDDVDWYGALADERGVGKTILELGAGSGRIAIPIASAGHRVLALDRMQPMLDHLFLKLDRLAQAGEPIAGSIEPLLADMTQIPLADHSVGLVIAPFNCLMHLYTWRELLACFREVYRVLEPGGSFGFDVLLPDLDWLRWDPHERHAVTRFEHPRTGEQMIYSTNHEYDPDTQICDVRIYYDAYDEEWDGLRPGVKPLSVVHLAHRQIFPEEARALLGIVGFEIESHTGDFLDLSLSSDVEVQVFVCTKGAG